MRTLNFAKRNFREMMRDPLSIVFALALPLFLLFIFQQFKIPGQAYLLENFTPAIIIFGFSFLTLFTATLVSKDRESSLLSRLGVSPMKSSDYVLGYLLAVLPVAIIQNTLFFAAAIALGLDLSFGIVLCILLSLPISLLFIGLGILVGSCVSEKAASGVGSIAVQLVAFTGGMYFDASLVSDFFAFICKVLPFSGTVDILRGALAQSASGLLTPSLTVALYTVAVLSIAITVFGKKMRR